MPDKKAKTAQQKRMTTIMTSIVFIVALVLGFSVLYFDDHSWGTWGDDSAGYVFLAGRMLAGEPLVYYDELAAAGLEFFGDEKLARWLTPTHHQFINTQGVIASKYPVGAPLLLLAGAKLYGSGAGFYLVTPVLAVLNLVLVYILALLLFPRQKFRHLIGFLSAISLGVSSLYYDYAIAQPMREIPSICFILLLAIFLILGVRQVKSGEKKHRWLAYGLFALSGLACGMAFNIRETAVLVVPGAIVFAMMVLWQKEVKIWTNIKKMLPYALTFLLAAIIAITPTIQNSINISKDKEVFKARDTSEVVVLSNIGHVESLSLQNIFDNQGKFRPGKGSLPHYWNIMQKSTPLPYFLVLVLVGIFYLWKESKPKTLFLVLWAFGVLTIFSLWVNPYSRYILPLFPPLILIGVYGLFALVQRFLPAVFKQKKIVTALAVVIAGAFIAGYQPIFASINENLITDVYRFKAISQNDLNTVIQIGEDLQAYEKPVLMFAGDWQYGISETMQAHTGLKTVRFPFEQRFEFDEEQVDAFFEQMKADGYTLFVWSDVTASADFFEWFAQQEVTEVSQHEFSFEPAVTIHKVW
ncbi:hypothetical protein ACFL2M_01735 [Patescibacteria group bacterium]